ncbi:hypothetical protein Tco_0452472 [Tanacetum coccineum]
MWSQVMIVYDKHALWGISHWGQKHQQFYGFAVNRESARDVYSRYRIIAIAKLKIVEWHNYKHLDWIIVLEMTTSCIHSKKAITIDFAFNTSKTFIKRRVEDLQLRIESYQKKLNLTHPDTDCTLNDVRSALDDILKRIQMKYLPQTVCRNVDRERAGAMIQAINRQLRNRRIMRSLEKFIGGRLSILTDSKVYIKMVMEVPGSSWVTNP